MKEIKVRSEKKGCFSEIMVGIIWFFYAHMHLLSCTFMALLIFIIENLKVFGEKLDFCMHPCSIPTLTPINWEGIPLLYLFFFSLRRLLNCFYFYCSFFSLFFQGLERAEKKYSWSFIWWVYLKNSCTGWLFISQDTGWSVLNLCVGYAGPSFGGLCFLGFFLWISHFHKSLNYERQTEK